MSVEPVSIAIARTVPEQPPRRSLSSRPRSPRPALARPKPIDDDLFWIARELLRTETDAERAAILLRVPDLVLWQKSQVLMEACEACGFNDGVRYITVRAAAASATRSPNGELPAATADQLEFWRRGLVAIAGRQA
jgi:hypothetical protein